MEFPITELLDYENSIEWILKHFHPQGRQCPKCQSPIEQSREFRRSLSSDLLVQRCLKCGAIYNRYTGTVFQGSQWTPMQVILLMRGICKGELTRALAAELELNYKTVLTMRHRVTAKAEIGQPTPALADTHSETDGMFEKTKEKR